jgi:hypothetical protein
MRWTFALVGCVVLRAAGAQPPKTGGTQPSKPKIDPKADEQLRKMTQSLAGISAMQFDADHTLEVVTRDGEKLQFLARSRLSVQRPNKLRSDRIGALADLTLYYDGQKITIYGKRLNMYASIQAPSTLDEAIDFARDRLDIEAPAADLLYTDAYEGLMKDVVSGQYIGLEPIGERMCHHLAFREKYTDWQLWVEDSAMALPCRYIIISTNITGEPEFSVTFTNWNTSPKLEGLDFVFNPPHDATKIEFWSERRTKDENQTKPPRAATKEGK